VRGLAQELIQVGRITLAGQRPQAFPQDPQPHDVAQKADSAVDAPFVGDVGLLRRAGEDG